MSKQVLTLLGKSNGHPEVFISCHLFSGAWMSWFIDPLSSVVVNSINPVSDIFPLSLKIYQMRLIFRLKL